MVGILQYLWVNQLLRDPLGPIVRVTPNEIHIRDSQFFDKVYTGNKTIAKPGWDVKMAISDASFTTVDGARHRHRRTALSPLFVPISY